MGDVGHRDTRSISQPITEEPHGDGRAVASTGKSGIDDCAGPRIPAPTAPRGVTGVRDPWTGVGIGLGDADEGCVLTSIDELHVEARVIVTVVDEGHRIGGRPAVIAEVQAVRDTDLVCGKDRRPQDGLVDGHADRARRVLGRGQGGGVSHVQDAAGGDVRGGVERIGGERNAREGLVQEGDPGLAREGHGKRGEGIGGGSVGWGIPIMRSIRGRRGIRGATPPHGRVPIHRYTRTAGEVRMLATGTRHIQDVGEGHIRTRRIGDRHSQDDALSQTETTGRDGEALWRA